MGTQQNRMILLGEEEQGSGLRFRRRRKRSLTDFATTRKEAPTMKQGALIFDERTDRYDIRFDLADYYGGLHCGQCFDVMVGGRWKPTRIEYAADWYLVGIRADDLNGLRVRI